MIPMKQAIIKLHLAVFLWGFTGILGKAITLNEVILVWYRLAITVVSLVILQHWTGRIPRVHKAMAIRFLGSGSLLAAHWVFFYGSIKYGNVSIALVCLSATGLFTSLLTPVVHKGSVAMQEVFFGLLSMAGICIIFHFDPAYQTGIVLGLLAALILSFYTILSKGQVSGHSSQTVMVYQLGAGLLLLTALMPVYLYFGPPVQLHNLVPAGFDWIWLLIMSWLCTIVSMNLALQSLKLLSAFTQSLTTNLEPVYGVLFSFIIYREHEHLHAGFFLGFGLIVLAVVLQTGMIRRLPG